MKITNVGIDEEGLKHLNEFVDRINTNAKRTIGRYSVLGFAAQLLNDSHIPVLLAKHYRPSDKFKVLLEEINRDHKDSPLDEERLMADMIEAYQAKRKSIKPLK
jgi:hypothetical protein